MAGHRYPRLLISAANKSAGKTLLTLGLSAAFRDGGVKTRLYKKGPDYIDPLWHKMASGYESHNLDSYMIGPALSRDIFLKRSLGFALSLIEGNLGLHDGMSLEGEDSSAALARLLEAPVLLVVDSTGMNRNAAAIVHGLQHFDPLVTVGGVVLNRVRSPRQETKQRQAIEHHCGVPVLGAIPLQDTPLVRERHLGLITPVEESRSADLIARMRELVSAHVELGRVREIAAAAPPLDYPGSGATPQSNATGGGKGPSNGSEPNGSPRLKIGVARDPAFCFHYPENLAALENAGAELVFFDTLRASALPEMDGLFLAGGFPESFAAELAANRPLRAEIAERIEAGLPTYAECGGMMYLTRSLRIDGVASEMVGVIPADVLLQKKPAGYGYVELSPGETPSWLHLERSIRGHEFHYSQLVNVGPEIRYAFAVKRGEGMGGQRDGIVYKNLLASYAHLHASSVPEWSRDFVARAREWRNGA